MPNKRIHDSLEGISTFIRVVEAGSFTQAASHLGHSVSFISKEIGRLEERLGVRLLNRTTRSLSLTDVGRAYYEKTRPLLDEAREAEQSIYSLHQEPMGTLKVSLPLSFGQSHLLPIMDEYMRRYPEIKLEIDFSSRLVDLSGEGFDVVIRMGESKDSNLICRRFKAFKMLTVAAPDYLQKHGVPVEPNDLKQHLGIKYTYNNTPITWEYCNGGNGVLNVEVPEVVRTNNLLMVQQMVLSGVGIARLPDYLCKDVMEQGLLQPVLREFECEAMGIYVVFQHRNYLTAKVRAFIDLLNESFNES